MSKDQCEIVRKLRIHQHADETGHVAKTCRYFGVGAVASIRGVTVTGNMVTPGLVNFDCRDQLDTLLDDTSGPLI